MTGKSDAKTEKAGGHGKAQNSEAPKQPPAELRTTTAPPPQKPGAGDTKKE